MINMTNRQKEFIKKLADLCEVYQAEFFYTINDDGIHINVDREEIFIGFMHDGCDELKAARDNITVK